MKPRPKFALKMRSLLWRGRNLLALSLVSLLGTVAFATPQTTKTERSQKTEVKTARVQDIAQTAPPPAPQQAPPAPPSTLFLLQQIEEGVSAIAQKVNPCVVTIEGSREIPINRNNPPRTSKSDKEESKLDEEFKINGEVFAQAFGVLNRGLITGSGFLIPGGFVVTTAEVMAKMQDPTVIFSEGQRVKPLWVNTDKESNLAVIKLPGIPAEQGLHWGNSERVQQGNFAITLGNQGGFANSISLGLISGKGRAGRAGEVRYRNLIQFQGVVGKGGSGGPLLNSRGEVIGMIVATPGISFGFQGVNVRGQGKKDKEEDPETRAAPFALSMAVSNIGFAVPSDDIQNTVALLAQRKTVSAKIGWLGIAISDNESDEVVLTGIYEKGPADKAGLLPNDTILSINDQEIKSGREFRPLLRKLTVGETLRVLVRRNKREMTVLLLFEPRPSESEIEHTHIKHEAE